MPKFVYELVICFTPDFDYNILMMADQSSKTQWHRLFGRLLQELLTPIGISVETEVDVLSTPPKVDILILRRETSAWTEEQRGYLPDGVRDSQASHLLLEFKYTESVNQAVFETVTGYDRFYRQGRNLSRAEVQSFIISAKTPRQQPLTDFGYRETAQAGVYWSDNILLANSPLLVLNQLSDAPHNVFFKLFASRRRVKLQAVTGIQQWWISRLSQSLSWLIRGLLRLWFTKGVTVVEEITAEGLIEQGKLLKEVILPMLTMEELEEVLGDTPYVKRIRDQSIEKGRQAMAQTVSRILALRFNIPLDHFNEAFQTLDLAAITRLSEIAFDVDSLSDFERHLAEILAEVDDQTTPG